MGTCWNCDSEFTLKNEETKCDNCREIINFKCHNCHQWFSIKGEDGKRIGNCKYCGYFNCPKCNICGKKCESFEYQNKVEEIISGKGNVFTKAKKIVDYFADIKIGKDRRTCPHGVSISYAKNRIKTCIVRMKGYKVKDQEDMDIFKERLEHILDKTIGEVITINQSREKGSYGQEFRDVFNLAICMGKLQRIKIFKIIDGEKEEIEVYKRIEKGDCPMLDIKDLIVKECPRKDCKIKTYPESETHCCCPECRYKKGKKKGQLRELKLKISNKDTCQLTRSDFKKEGDKDGEGRD